jgi:uncharacterized protein YraI
MRVWRNWSLPMAVAAAHVVAGLYSGPAVARELCVGKESVLLRSGPSGRHDPVGSLPSGACGVQVVGTCVSGWCDVALGGRRGWVDSRLVTVREGGATPAPAPPKRAEPPPPRPAPPTSTGAASDGEGHCVMGVKPSDTLRIRSGPGVRHREVGEIPPNACDVIIAGPCTGSWCPVSYRGIRGWSNASYLRPPWMR